MTVIDVSSGELGGLFDVGESLLNADLPFGSDLVSPPGVSKITLKKYGGTTRFVSVGLTREATLGFASLIGMKKEAEVLFPNGIYVFAKARSDNTAVSMGLNFLAEVPLINCWADKGHSSLEESTIGYVEYAHAFSLENSGAFEAFTSVDVSVCAGSFAVDIATRTARGF